MFALAAHCICKATKVQPPTWKTDCELLAETAVYWHQVKEGFCALPCANHKNAAINDGQEYFAKSTTCRGELADVFVLRWPLPATIVTIMILQHNDFEDVVGDIEDISDRTKYSVLSSKQRTNKC